LGVRSHEGVGSQARGVTAAAPPTLNAGAAEARLDVRVTNTGTGQAATSGHPGAPADVFGSDIFRVSASVEGAGVVANVQSALVAIGQGKSATVPVFVRRTDTRAAPGRVIVTIVSESDPSKRATVSSALGPSPAVALVDSAGPRAK
jgi:hypothetical protein